MVSSQGGLSYQLHVISGRGMWLILSRNYVKYHKDEKAQFNPSVLKLCKHALSVINIVRFFLKRSFPLSLSSIMIIKKCFNHSLFMFKNTGDGPSLVSTRNSHMQGQNSIPKNQ